MDPTYSEEAEAFREKVQAFLAEKLPSNWKGVGALPNDEVKAWGDAWRATLSENNLLAPAWPTKYGGGGLSKVEQVVLAEEFQRAGVPTGGSNDAFSIQMVGNTILALGSEEMREEFLPKIISGEYVFCQGYSEPNAGSDLAGLMCKAELDGDEWIINGQKIWTSAGQFANWIFVLCRTDFEVSKHRGISFILCPMDQPGIEVRPIAMMSGESEFNETFFTDARANKNHVVGEVNGGWMVAMALLGYERGAAAATTPVTFRGELDKLTELAREKGVLDHPHIRERITKAWIDVEIMRLLGKRTLTGFLAGNQPGPQESVFKLFWSEHHKRVTELAVDILGADAMIMNGSSPANSFGPDYRGSSNDSGSWVGTFFNARAGTIYAGTSEVQKNILGEMVLGLPKEPKPAAAK